MSSFPCGSDDFLDAELEMDALEATERHRDDKDDLESDTEKQKHTKTFTSGHSTSDSGWCSNLLQEFYM